MTARCVWPRDDPKLPGFSFCGAAVAQPGLPYCPVHMGLAYPRSRRPRPTRLHKSAPRPREPRGTGLAAVGSDLAEPVR
jgi:GcrA cell cycle regulator